MKEKIKKLNSSVKNFFSSINRKVEKRPLLSFFLLLALLIGLIIASYLIRKPKEAPKSTPSPAKQVQVYRIGSAPKLSLQAQVEKTGVIVVVAQTGGIVQNIYHKEGETVDKGSWLIGLSTNYQGGNVFALQRAMAYKQYKNAEESFPVQQELINKQKELAEKNDMNSDELRKITSRSIDETKAALNLNGDILSTLDKNLQQYEATNSAGQNSALILSIKQLKSQYVGANNQLQTALRNAEYSSSDENAPAQLSNISKDIALKQLEIQQKTIQLGKEISHLQLRIAQVNEGLMYPAAPFAASVQRVHVRVGQAVQPGTPLVTIDCDQGGQLKAVVTAPKEVIDKVSKIEPSVLHIEGFNYTVHPSFTSQEATHGSLYSIIYEIPQEFQNKLTDKSYIPVDVPVGYFDTGSTVPFVPIDAIYQTNDSAYIFVEKGGKAKSEQVNLGGVFGRFVEIKSGIKNGNAVILSRNVIDGDKVVIQ